MKYLILILYLLIGTASYLPARQKPEVVVAISPKVKTLVDKIAKYGKYESERVGFAGTPSEQFKNYKQLLKIATTQELKLLVLDESPVVKVYAFQALAENDTKSAVVIAKSLEKDTAVVYTLEGCIGGEATVQELAMRIIQ